MEFSKKLETIRIVGALEPGGPVLFAEAVVHIAGDSTHIRQGLSAMEYTLTQLGFTPKEIFSAVT